MHPAIFWIVAQNIVHIFSVWNVDFMPYCYVFLVRWSADVCWGWGDGWLQLREGWSYCGEGPLYQGIAQGFIYLKNNTLCLNCRFTAVKDRTNSEGSFCFLVDGDRVGYIEDFDLDLSTQQGSGTINLYLTAGQAVQVENWASTTIYGTWSIGYHSWFIGLLLYGV